MNFNNASSDNEYTKRCVCLHEVQLAFVHTTICIDNKGNTVEGANL
jgi:hypothetical protein